MALRVGELAQLNGVHHLLGTHHAGPTEALGLRERGLDVGHRDVEGDVAAVALGPSRDASADPHAVRARVPVALDDPVPHRIAGVDLPSEEVCVVALKLPPVLPDDLEVDHRLSHLFLLSGPAWPAWPAA